MMSEFPGECFIKMPGLKPAVLNALHTALKGRSSTISFRRTCKLVKTPESAFFKNHAESFIGKLWTLLFCMWLLIANVAASPSQQARPRYKNSRVATTDSRAEAAHRNNLGAAYMNQQEFQRALNLFRQAAVLDPKLDIAKVNQGIALVYLQKYGPARTILNRVTKADPSNVHTWYALGLMYKNQGDTKSALEAFQSAAKLAPNDPDVFYFIGLVQSEIGQQQEAIAAFQHALELNQFHASAEFALARSLQRSGGGEKAREHLARFQHLVQAKLGAPMSQIYGDQGPLSLALQVGNATQPFPVPIAVRFTDVTRASGLPSSFSGSNSGTPANQPGPGACFFDLDSDGRPDLFLAGGGPQGTITLLHNAGSGKFGVKFEDITRKAGLDPTMHAIGCAAGDYDNDGHTDLVITTDDRVVVFHNEGNGTLKNVTDAVGIRTQHPPLAAAFVDYDHDGDLDLFVSSSEAGKNVLWRNNGNSTFTDVTAEVGFGGDTTTNGMIATDFNNDRAIDLIFAASQPQLFLNPREGKWSPVALWTQPLPQVTAAASLDFDKDGWMDVAFTHDGSPGITLWRNLNGKSVEQVQLPIQNWQRAWGIAALDYDNDGWIDLAAVGETKDGRAELRLFRNLGKAGFKDVTSEVGLDKLSLKSPRALVVADVDGDGDTDLLITQTDGPALLLRNDGGNRNNFLRVSLTGFNDNKSAIGTKVEVFAGALWQKWEIGGFGYLSQSATDLLVGLGKERKVDIVRSLWPTGVVQDEAQIASNSARKINEIDRRGSSCPVLFVWDGSRYRFVADMLGAGVVGHWIGPGERNIPDSTEYIKIEGEHIRQRNGLLSFRFMEPLEEVVYLDQARLLAIDHPRNLEVYPNEYFASNPPFPEFKVIASRHALPVTGAWDEHRHSVSQLLAQRDHRYVTGFELLPYIGFTKPHTLELDLPHVYRGGPLRLLLYGYIEYFTANSMYAAWQAGINPVAPYIEAQDANGKWVRVVDDMGFPAGLPRSTVADLTGKLPKGSKRVRITTNLQIYWDQILVDDTPDQETSVKVTPLSLAAAKLDFHGYPRMVEGRSPGDLKFIYEEVSPTGPFARPIGAYTRPGDVRDLLLDSDDRFVVFGSGDEIQLTFDPAGLPPLPPGWKRDYFFLADGYEKDMDFYAADGLFVDPLPFHNMRQYPYTIETFPWNEMRLNDLLNYNTRFFSDVPPSSYSFHYREHQPKGRR
jgi:Flp pilus assembly protein TadD